MLANLESLGYNEMTPIQAQSLPVMLKGMDLIAQAKTGSGKTAAFGIGLLNPLNPRYFGCQSLVICPTRELADQVAKELRRLARSADNIKILTLCGGVPFGPQIGSLEHGAQIIVGTPGRIQQHLSKGTQTRRPQYPGARRSRPYARHGLLRQHRRHHQPDPDTPADPAVLRHLPGRDQAAVRDVYARSTAGQSGRPARRHTDRAAFLRNRARRAHGRGGQAAQQLSPAVLRGLLLYQAAVPGSGRSPHR